MPTAEPAARASAVPAANPSAVALTGGSDAALLDSGEPAARAESIEDAGEPGRDGGADAAQTAQPTMRYREFLAGALPYRARLRTQTLQLGGDGRFTWTDEQAEAEGNSLVREKPLGQVRVLGAARYSGAWSQPRKGELVLVFEGDAGAAIHCAEGTVQALEPGAGLRLTPVPGDNANRARWAPSSRRRVHVWNCDRAWLAPAEFLWSDEPQPSRLPMADWPGVEYAHDNSDMAVQKGGLRRIGR